MEETPAITQIDCPYCAEPINAKSRKCRHCGEILDQQLRDIEMLKSQRNSPHVFMNSGGGAASSAAAASSSSAPADPGLQTFPHGFHLILVFFTGLLWLPFYIFMYAYRDRRKYY